MVLMTIITRRDCEKRQVTSQDFIHWRICSHCIQFFSVPNARIGAPGFHHYLIIDMNTDTWRQPEIANLIIQAGAGVLIPVAWVFWHLILGNKRWSFGSVPDLLQTLTYNIYLVKNILKYTSISSIFIPIITIFADILHSDDTHAMHHPRLLHAAYLPPLSWCWLPLQNIGQGIPFPIPTWRCRVTSNVIPDTNHPPVSRTLLSRVAALIARLAEGSAPVATVTQAEARSGVRISVVARRPLCSPPVTRYTWQQVNTISCNI